MKVAKKTIYVQLCCLAMIGFCGVAGIGTTLKFKKECYDDTMKVSVAGIATRVMNMLALLLWRVVTLTMLIFFERHARQVPTKDL